MHQHRTARQNPVSASRQHRHGSVTPGHTAPAADHRPRFSGNEPAAPTNLPPGTIPTNASRLFVDTAGAPHADGNPPSHSVATRPQGLLRRSLLRLTVLVLGIAGLLGLVGVSGASASVNIAGDIFTTTVDCGGSSMLINSYTSLDTTAYTMVYLQDRSTGTWIHESSWHPVTSWSKFRTADFTFNRTAYYNVYLQYLQWTTTGWQQRGENMTHYNQHVGLSQYRSTTCRML